MKNIASLKSNDTNSPKTPGGISKSLLTPCRRLGLSRNWRKSGPSPFISPLASGSTDVAIEKKETRKRKERIPDENAEQTDNTPVSIETEVSTEQLTQTPTKNVEAHRKKKSKTLVEVINKAPEQEAINEVCQEQSLGNTQTTGDHGTEPEVVSTPVRTRSKKSKKCISPLKSSNNEVNITPQSKENLTNSVIDKEKGKEVYTIKERSPNDLKKECIVVIQKKIFKDVENNIESTKNTIIKDENTSKVLDSDSDDAPLINIQKENLLESNFKQNIKADDDFINKKTVKSKINKVKDSKSSNVLQKASKSVKKSTKISVELKPSSPCSFNDDDDDDFDSKKTIIIKKTYDKVSKPLKAKSTGSITQRDIDNLRDRIEAKKKLLLAKTLTPDTQELRDLIKKWQKGCQDALMELLDLMRNKFADKKNMDYSEMLKTLKIPPSLVGYDSENDCFVTPDDTNIILGEFNDI